MTISEACHHYAPMGMSMSAIAETMGIERHTFFELVKDAGLRHLFASARYARDCKGGGNGWTKGRPRPYKPKRDGRFILSELKRYPDVGLFKTFADVDYKTVWRRFGCFAAAHKFAQLSSPADPEWHYVAELADRKRSAA